MLARFQGDVRKVPMADVVGFVTDPGRAFGDQPADRGVGLAALTLSAIVVQVAVQTMGRKLYDGISRFRQEGPVLIQTLRTR